MCETPKCYSRAGVFSLQKFWQWLGASAQKLYCRLVSAPCLGTLEVARPTAGAGKLHYAHGDAFFCSLADVVGLLLLLLGVTKINKGFAFHPTLLPSAYTRQGHLRAPGPGQEVVKKQVKRTPHGPALHFLACMVVSQHTELCYPCRY